MFIVQLYRQAVRILTLKFRLYVKAKTVLMFVDCFG